MLLLTISRGRRRSRSRSNPFAAVDARMRASRSSSVDFGETAADVDPSESSPTFSECVAPKDEVKAG